MAVPLCANSSTINLVDFVKCISILLWLNITNQCIFPFSLYISLIFGGEIALFALFFRVEIALFALLLIIKFALFFSKNLPYFFQRWVATLVEGKVKTLNYCPLLSYKLWLNILNHSESFSFEYQAAVLRQYLEPACAMFPTEEFCSCYWENSEFSYDWFIESFV